MAINPQFVSSPTGPVSSNTPATNTLNAGGIPTGSQGHESGYDSESDGGVDYDPSGGVILNNAGSSNSVCDGSGANGTTEYCRQLAMAEVIAEAITRNPSITSMTKDKQGDFYKHLLNQLLTEYNSCIQSSFGAQNTSTNTENMDFTSMFN